MSKRPLSVLTLRDWVHDPKKRSHRFRCQTCGKLIADHSDIMIERRPGGAHGYHAECFVGLAAEAAIARQAERLAQ